MNAGSANWNWPEVENVLGALVTEGDLVVCGGQAVGFWARHFGLLSVISQDLDVIADREAAKRIADRLGGVTSFPGRYDMTILTAVVRVVWEGRPLNVECLSSVPGLESDPEAISERIVLGVSGHIRVLHPMALVMAKLHAVRFLDQAERHDEAHLRTIWVAAQRWMADLAGADAPRALRLIQQWYRTVRQPANRRVLDRLHLDWKALVPIERLRDLEATDPLIARFLAEQWPRLIRG